MKSDLWIKTEQKHLSSLPISCQKYNKAIERKFTKYEKNQRETATKFWKLLNRWISNQVLQLAEQKSPNHKLVVGKMKRVELKVAQAPPELGGGRKGLKDGGWGEG